MIRATVIVLSVLVALGVAGGGALYAAQDVVLDRAIRDQLNDTDDPSWTADDGHFRVLLVGTGSPEPAPARQPCAVVAAGGKVFVIDAGEGAAPGLAEARVPVQGVERVLLTHLHSDHFNGLGAVINESWIWGRTSPLQVVGPSGTSEVVGSLAAAYSADVGFRSTHMTDLADHAQVSRADARDITFAPGARQTRVFDEGGVTIDARLVEHEPVEPSVGYVIGYAGKKVFVSGDTRVSSQNEPAMADADLVVHEAYATHLVRRALPIMHQLGQDGDAHVAELTMSYHADTLELAQQAEGMRVKHLVLTHLTPYPRNAVARYFFTKGMSQRYHGELTLGRDGMRFEV